MTRYYELNLTPGIKEAERTFFRSMNCASCGLRLEEQIADLALVTEPEVTYLPGVLVAPGGSVVVRANVRAELGALGLVGHSRPASVGGSRPGEWYQIEPKAAVPLVRSSLRDEPLRCDTCGGQVRPSFDGRWVVDAGSESGVFAVVRGASQIKVVSRDVADTLRRLAPGVELRPLPDKETAGPIDDPHGWGDL